MIFFCMKLFQIIPVLVVGSVNLKKKHVLFFLSNKKHRLKKPSFFLNVFVL